MDRALIITKPMLIYRENIWLTDVDTFIFDMETAIEEFRYALYNDTEKLLDMKYINNIISYSNSNNIGLGDAFQRVIFDLNFPFRFKSLFGAGKKVLITKMNGSLERLEKLENFKEDTLIGPLFRDQIDAENADVYDISDAIKNG